MLYDKNHVLKYRGILNYNHTKIHHNETLRLRPEAGLASKPEVGCMADRHYL
jgi:hypothetical protein